MKTLLTGLCWLLILTKYPHDRTEVTGWAKNITVVLRHDVQDEYQLCIYDQLH